MILLSLFTPSLSFAKGGNKTIHTENLIEILLSYDHILKNPPSISTYNSTYQKTLTAFEEKKQKWNQDKRFLAHVFFKIHQEYLKKYAPLPSFKATLKNGTYGCLTGTILYALFLKDLGYNYELIESNYHIVLIVKVKDERFLFEATDPIHGFITNSSQIDSKLAAMQAANRGKGEKGKYYFTTQTYNKVTLSNLIGLQLYNMAIVAYNHHNFKEAAKLLSHAKRYYSSERLEEFSQLLISQLNAQLISGIQE
ncbi:MAG: hypothetical protein ACPGJS_11245 [Flammeovirgaceae bacterium]